MVAGIAGFVLVSQGAKKLQIAAVIVILGASLWFALPHLPGYETATERVTGMGNPARTLP